MSSLWRTAPVSLREMTRNAFCAWPRERLFFCVVRTMCPLLTRTVREVSA